VKQQIFELRSAASIEGANFAVNDNLRICYPTTLRGLRRQQETVRDAVCKEISRNYARRVDAGANGAMSARSIEQRDGAIRGTQEAMIHVMEVVVESNDLPCRIDGNGERPRTAR
jgi:hypothetical protein